MNRRAAGFALLDVLLALLLLAVALTGACATLVQTMRSTREALLATRAVDLATDLAEALRGADTPQQTEAVLEAWRVRAGEALPTAGLAAEHFADLRALPTTAEIGAAGVVLHELTLRWRSSADGAVSALSLPLALSAAASP